MPLGGCDGRGGRAVGSSPPISPGAEVVSVLSAGGLFVVVPSVEGAPVVGSTLDVVDIVVGADDVDIVVGEVGVVCVVGVVGVVVVDNVVDEG